MLIAKDVIYSRLPHTHGNALDEKQNNTGGGAKHDTGGRAKHDSNVSIYTF